MPLKRLSRPTSSCQAKTSKSAPRAVGKNLWGRSVPHGTESTGHGHHAAVRQLSNHVARDILAEVMEFVPVCPKKSLKTPLEFHHCLCKNSVVRNWASQPIRKFHVRKELENPILLGKIQWVTTSIPGSATKLPFHYLQLLWHSPKRNSPAG